MPGFDDLDRIHRQAASELASASDAQALEAFRTRWLGRKGELSGLLRGVKDLPVDARRDFGARANEVRAALQTAFDEKKARLTGPQQAVPAFDFTLPGREPPLGKKHVLTQVTDEIVHIFYGMGFEVADGPEIETDYYNFGALNFPPDHPARDMQDTFFLGGEYLLRTHTSPVQVRVFEKRRPPVRILAPGRSYRHEAINARSYCMFHQVEGFYADTDVSFADLKGVVVAFVEQFFGREAKLRFRPSFFPFTEPSTEVDLSCLLCGGSGCQLCKYEGWLEILGAGMIDPEVFRAVNYDPELITGYAFGMGIERLALMKYRIDDIRLFFENDLRFLAQF
jgi:phenylalanyl-tRNA synthetase alpha chain